MAQLVLLEQTAQEVKMVLEAQLVLLEQTAHEVKMVLEALQVLKVQLVLVEPEANRA